MADLKAKLALFAAVQQTDRVPLPAKVLFGTLLFTHHNTATGQCNPGIELLRKETNLSRAAVYASIKALVAAGFLLRNLDGRKDLYAFPSLDVASDGPASIKMDHPNGGKTRARVHNKDRSSPPNSTETVHYVDSGVHYLDSSVHQVDHNREYNQEENTHPLTPKPRNREGVGEKDLRSVEERSDDLKLWLKFSSAFPKDDLDFEDAAKSVWDRLTETERHAAAQFAPAYVAAARARNQKLRRRENYLRGRCWGQFAAKAASQAGRAAASIPRATSGLEDGPTEAAIRANIRRLLDHDDTFFAWFADVTIKQTDSATLTLTSPLKFKAAAIREKYDSLVRTAARQADPRCRHVNVVSAPPAAGKGNETATSASPTRRQTTKEMSA